MSSNRPDQELEGEDEDDYMSMVIQEPKQKETFTQRKRREQREAEARGKTLSKAERAAQEATRREEALSKSTLDPTNKGFKMMAKLGFKAGQSLGKKPSDEAADESNINNETNGQNSSHRRAEPLNLILKEGRGGIGLDNEKKRKIREEAEEATKKIKQDEGDYRDRVREERETRRTEAQVRAAQKVAERMDTADDNGTAASPDSKPQQEQAQQQAQEQAQARDYDQNGDDGVTDDAKSKSANADSADDHPPSPRRTHNYKPTAQINVLYRGLVREREERERNIQARHALQSSLPSSFFPNMRLPTFDGSELEREDQQALGTREAYTAAVEQEVEEEDLELDAFNELPPAERLHKLVVYLRDTYRYCFWCKYQYENDQEFEGCPGLTEEDHD